MAQRSTVGLLMLATLALPILGYGVSYAANAAILASERDSGTDEIMTLLMILLYIAIPYGLFEIMGLRGRSPKPTERHNSSV